MNKERAACLKALLYSYVRASSADQNPDGQLGGIALAKTLGVYWGWKRALTSKQAIALRQSAKTEKKAALARECGIGRDTVYEYLREPEPETSGIGGEADR